MASRREERGLPSPDLTHRPISVNLSLTSQIGERAIAKSNVLRNINSKEKRETEDMNSRSSEQLIIEIENYSKTQNLSKKEIARRFDIPYNTFKKWFLKGKIKRIPSKIYLDKIQNVFESQRKKEQYWEESWIKILKWWETQHRYSSIREFADDIGWDTQSLFHHIQSKKTPPKIIIEKISKILGLEIPGSDFNLQDTKNRVEKVKFLLILLEDELRWFRDSSEENRNALRQTLDFSDVGYISSLLTMIADESQFIRWITLTTNRYNFFRKKGGTKNEKGPD